MHKLFFMMIFVPLPIFAQQQSAFVAGRVIESSQQDGVASVSLRLPELGINVQSDSAGKFFLRVPARRAVALEIRRWGYFSQTRRLPAIAAGETLQTVITLTPNPIAFEGIVVWGEGFIEKTPALVNHSAAYTMRQPGAFEDPLRALQQIPGISMRSDWDSQISVRGATPDQNLVVIDGFTLPNPYRLQFALGGGLSLLNLGILERAQLWKSGFSVRHGDRVAGLIALHTQSPLQPRRFEARLNVFDASFTASLSTPARRSGILFAVRRNYHDAFSGLARLRGYAIPRWQDVQVKAATQLSTQHQIEMFGLLSKEWLDLTFGDAGKLNVQEASQSAFAGAASRWAIAPNVIWENYLSHFQAPTQTYFLNATQVESTAAAYDFDDRLWAWRSEITQQSSVRSQWLFGMEMQRQRQWADLRSGFDNLDSPIALPENYHSRRTRTLAAFYGEGKLAWSEKLIVQAGLRWAGDLTAGALHAEPRLSLSGAWPRFNYLLHAGRYRQTMDWQSLFRREWPMDISDWRTLPDEKAWLFSAETKLRLTRDMEVALAVYRRSLDPLIVLIDESEGMVLELRERETSGGFSSQPELQANRPRVARGKYYGIEAAWSLAQPVWNVALHYAYARSRMRDLDDQKWIDAATDRPHDAALDLAVKPFRQIEISGHARYTTGNPYSPVLALERDPYHERWPAGYRFIYAARNSGRYPDYVRLDLRVSHSFQSWNSAWQIYVECLNLANRENIYQILWTPGEDMDTSPNVVKRRIPMLPRLFLGGIAVRF